MEKHLATTATCGFPGLSLGSLAWEHAMGTSRLLNFRALRIEQPSAAISGSCLQTLRGGLGQLLGGTSRTLHGSYGQGQAQAASRSLRSRLHPHCEASTKGWTGDAKGGKKHRSPLDRMSLRRIPVILEADMGLGELHRLKACKMVCDKAGR